MNNYSYIEPKVKLLTSNGVYLGFYVWMKSRQWIIGDRNGNRFMSEMDYSPTWIDKVPNRFYVGDELVSKSEYMDRINKMNLQYNNFENFVFEIDGSCLFRDFLYNVNKISQWAQSNRFLFSILDSNARYNPENYHISSEYRGIPEWELQFDKYMEAIKDDPIVDHNRLEMPYSISSKFWICVNSKTLKDLVSFMRYHVPFFYEVYGVQFNIPEDSLSEDIPASLNQYIIKNKITEERSTTVGDTVIVDSKMSLILYSQFLRQSDALVSGFYNELIHKNSTIFSHKVFKGSTTFMIHYVADISKVHHTISNRLCAFAMSSGSGPESWNYFISKFLKEEISPERLIELLPCKFCDNKLIKCKFHDDVKFRNEGKEISNIPCPLINLDIKVAESKKIRDNNNIGNAFYDLTKFLITKTK